MFDSARMQAAQSSLLATPLHVTTDWHPPLLEPLLAELRCEPCAHLWQEQLAAAPSSESYRVFVRAVTEGRPSTVFTYYLLRDGGSEAAAIGAISPRVTADTPEDGFPVLGRTYVRPGYRRNSVYTHVLRHRLSLCMQQWGDRLMGVHMGTSSPRVEATFRANFQGRVIRLGEEDLGFAGTVVALLGLTEEFDRQVAEPTPAHLARQHRLIRTFLTEGAGTVRAADAIAALRQLASVQTAYRLLGQFLDGLPNLK